MQTYFNLTSSQKGIFQMNKTFSQGEVNVYNSAHGATIYTGSNFNYFNTAIRLNNLLVDFLLPPITLADIAGIFQMQNQMKQVSIYTFLVVATLTLVKASTTFFATIIIG